MANPTSIAKIKLSSCTDGRAIKVAATATPGTLLHTANNVLGDNNFDEIWLWACNTDSTARLLTIEWGGTTSPDDTLKITIPPQSGWIPIVPGMILQNNVAVRAFAASANLVIVAGFVNRITA